MNKPRLQVYVNADPHHVRFKLPYGGSVGIGIEFFKGQGVHFVGALERARRHYLRANCRMLAQVTDDLIMQLFA